MSDRKRPEFQVLPVRSFGNSAEPLPARRTLVLNPRLKGVRFHARWDEKQRHTWIDDDDFTFDAILRISGDFGGKDEAMAYAQEIVDLLNATPTATPSASE